MKLLKQLPALKIMSPGYIDISITSIEEAKFIRAHHLAMSFTKCLAKGTYPDILKIGKVLPLHKGGCQTDLNNYRPISI